MVTDGTLALIQGLAMLSAGLRDKGYEVEAKRVEAWLGEVIEFVREADALKKERA